MAWRWRIRHKLLLGLGLVVVVMAVLLTGTLLGLLSYMTTVRMVDSKAQEMEKVNALKEVVDQLAALPEAGDQPADDMRKLRGKIDAARLALDQYTAQLKDTLAHHRDSDGGFQENQRIQGLQECFDRLDKALRAWEKGPQFSVGEGTQRVHKDPAVAAAIHGDLKLGVAGLVETTRELQETIYRELFSRINLAKGHYKWSMIAAITTSVVGILFMAGLLRFFYTWVFYPVRDVQLGANRVAQGDFDHRIKVHSGDEMEDLATAFNNMTGRLQEIYRDLNRQVHERSRQLVRSERLASVGFLAAGVAHEINNPLQAITLYSGALEARLAELVNQMGPAAERGQREHEVISRYLKTILEEAFRCKRITERLLEFSRGGERSREQVDLADLVQAVLHVAQPLPSARGKTITFRPAARVAAWVNADEIKSVVLNLVVNALDSMEEGGALTIRLGQKDALAELQFSDTGCGMPADVLENIFEPFYTKSRTGKGTGLGLTISHRIVVQHGGEIEADSPGVDRGSTFTVRLPMQPPAEEQKSEVRGQRSEVGSQKSEVKDQEPGAPGRERKAA